MLLEPAFIGPAEGVVFGIHGQTVLPEVTKLAKPELDELKTKERSRLFRLNAYEGIFAAPYSVCDITNPSGLWLQHPGPYQMLDIPRCRVE